MKLYHFYLSGLITAFIVVFTVTAAKHNVSDLYIYSGNTINAGQENRIEREQWFAAIIDEIVALRLNSISAIKLREINKYQTNYSKTESKHDDSSVTENLSKYRLSKKFELSNRGRSVYLYFELIPYNQNESDIISRRRFHINDTSTELDSLLINLLVQLDIGISGDYRNFFATPVISSNRRRLRSLGNALNDAPHNDDYENRARTFRRIANRDDSQLIAVYHAGLNYFKSGDYEVAARHFSSLKRALPLYEYFDLMLVRSFRMDQRFNEALRVIENHEKYNENPDFLIEKAIILHESGNIDEALNTHYQILSLAPETSISNLYLAQNYNKNKNYKKALTHTETYLKRNPNSSTGWFESAKSYRYLKQDSLAIIAIENALNYDTANCLDIIKFAADLYYSAEDYANAANYFKKAALRENELSFYLKAADAMRNVQRSEEAFSFLNSADNRFSQDHHFNRLTGILAYETNQYTEAETYLKRILNDSGTDKDVLFAIGDINLSNSNYTKALKYLYKANSLDTNDSQLKFYISKAYFGKQDYDNSFAYLNKLNYEKAPLEYYRLRGDINYKTGNLKDALSGYTSERDLHQNTSHIQYKIAKVNYELGNFKQAESEFNKLFEFDSTNNLARYYLGIIALKDAQNERAENILTIARERCMGNFEVNLNLGKLYNEQKRYEKAVKSYYIALSFDQTSQAALLGLATNLSLGGEDSAAAEYYVKLYNSNPDKNHQFLAYAGHLFRHNDFPKRAMKSYTTFLNDGYSDEAVNAGLASLLYKKGEFKKVSSYLKNINDSILKKENLIFPLAHSYCEISDYSSALPYLSILLESQTPTPHTVRLSALAYEKTGDVDNSIQMLEKYLDMENITQEQDYAFHLGFLYEELGQEQNAVDRYMVNINDYQYDIRNYKRLVDIYTQRNNLNKAEVTLAGLLELDDVCSSYYLKHAKINSSLNNKSKAIESYISYLSFNQNDIDAWRELTEIYLSNRQYSEAITTLETILKIDSDDQTSRLKLGMSQVETGNYSDAIRTLREVINSDKENQNALELLARCYRNRDDDRNLVRTLIQMADLNEQRIDIRLELGNLLMSNNDVQGSIQYLKEAYELNPTSENPHRLLAEAYNQLNNDSLQLYHLKSAVKYSPRNWNNHYQTALFMLKAGNEEYAKGYLKRTVNLNTNHSEARYKYSQIIFNRGDSQAAFNHLKIVVSQEPQNPYYNSLLAYAAQKVGYDSLANELTDKALSLSPSDPTVLYRAGMVHKYMNKRASAYNHLNRSLSISSDCYQCHEALGDLLMKDAKFKEAANHYNASSDLQGFNREIGFKIARAYRLDYQLEKAENFYKAILSDDSTNSKALYFMVYINAQKDNLQKSKDLLSNFKSNNGMEWIHAAKAHMYESENRNKAARISYMVAHRIDNLNSYINAGLGRVYSNQNQYDSALVFFSRALIADTLNMNYHMEVGNTYKALGEYDISIQYYDNVLKKYNTHPKVHMALADAYRQKQEYQNAINYLKQGLDLRPRDPSLHFMLGNIQKESEYFVEAIRSFQHAIRRGSRQYVEAYRIIGNIYLSELTNNRRARNYYRRYVRAGGDSQKEVIEILDNI
ncbi:tetratricopeptide repeat protein [Chitinispirillales bacterium ANBcel5]|uniref:tetratricopeptide repeat protein n=1 Tax=Cellulosispirillum alkaliphilum TaxID=3039283 RepID=UPI002A4F1254|nr:tetratricopeptide repeat protein [Chitinispirillales bacterium ANBcel5]